MEEGGEFEESRLMELFRAKWALSVLVVLEDRDHRFNELRRTIGAPANTMSDRLTELEDAGLVARTVQDGSPPSVSYSLTPRGRRVVEIIDRIDALPDS